MKKILLTSALSILSIFSSLFLFANNLSYTGPSATFDKLWVDYDVYDNGVKGMKIHVKFTAYDMLNMDAYLAIYFEFDDEVGGYLKDKNSKYNSSAGEVAVYKSIKPLYNPAVYDDLQVFMPYDELDLDPGEYDLSMDVKLIYKAGGVISKLTTHYFEYKKPGSTISNEGGKPDPTKITATFKELWIDFDVTENTQKGMRIHAKLSVSNMKDVDGSLAFYFEKKSGDKLTSTNPDFRSGSGQLAAYRTVKPGYANTDYNDLDVFVPYSVFTLSAGRNDLKIDVDLLDKSGALIQHLKYHDFWLNK